MKFDSPKIIQNAYIKCYRLNVLMNTNLKIGTLGVILGSSVGLWYRSNSRYRDNRKSCRSSTCSR